MTAYTVGYNKSGPMAKVKAGSAADILNAARELGMPIQRIILTHAHGDHLGSLDALHQLLPEAEVLVSARDTRFLAGDMRLDPSEPQVKLHGDYRPTAARPSRLLYEGDQVGSLQVVSTPAPTRPSRPKNRG